MKPVYSLLSAFLLYSVAASSVEDPLTDFVEWRTPGVKPDESFETVLWFLEDLDSDGDMEILVTDRGRRNARAGLIWRIYIKQDKSYEKSAQLLTIQPSFYLGKIPEVALEGIFDYSPSSAESGALVHTRWEDGRLVQTRAQEIFPKREDYKWLQKYFNTKQSPLIVETSVETIIAEGGLGIIAAEINARMQSEHQAVEPTPPADDDSTLPEVAEAASKTPGESDLAVVEPTVEQESQSNDAPSNSQLPLTLLGIAVILGAVGLIAYRRKR